MVFWFALSLLSHYYFRNFSKFPMAVLIDAYLSALCECWFTVLHCWITGTEPGVFAFSFHFNFFQFSIFRLIPIVCYF